jgi:hypothetical protein
VEGLQTLTPHYTTTSSFIPSITDDAFEESTRLVDKAVEKSALDMIKSPIGLSIIENMKATPSNRDLPSSFTEKRDLKMPTIVENPDLELSKFSPEDIHQETVTAPKTIGLTYEEVMIDAPNPSLGGICRESTTQYAENNTNDKLEKASDMQVNNRILGGQVMSASQSLE